MAITLDSSTITVNSGAVMSDPPGTVGLFFCRAWVRFNMTGTPVINGSGNVSSITDNAIGQFTVTFSTAMTDANYCTNFVVGDASGFLSGYAERHITATHASGTVAVHCASLSAYADATIVCVSIIR